MNRACSLLLGFPICKVEILVQTFGAKLIEGLCRGRDCSPLAEDVPRATALLRY